MMFVQLLFKSFALFCCISLFACQGEKSDTVADTSSKSLSQERVFAGDVVLQTILDRKSVREYTDKEIPKEVLDNLLKAGMAAPSSRDRRPWHFIVISDKAMMESLGTQLKNASCLIGADKAIVVCGDDKLSDNCWHLDCAAVTQNILIAAESMGLGAVWTAAYPYDDRSEMIRKTFDLPNNIHPFAIIPLGYPLEEGKAKDKFDETRIHYNKW